MLGLAAGDLLRGFDIASTVAAACLALAVATRPHGRGRLDVLLPAAVVAGLASLDQLDLHITLAHVLAGLLPFQGAGWLLKVGILGWVFGSAAAILVLGTRRDLAVPLLGWLVGLALVSAAGEVGGRVWPDLGMTAAWLEELAEVAVTALSCLAVLRARPAVHRPPVPRVPNGLAQAGDGSGGGSICGAAQK